MQNIPTADLIAELERRVDCSKRRGVRTILIGNCVFLLFYLQDLPVAERELRLPRSRRSIAFAISLLAICSVTLLPEVGNGVLV